MNASFSGQFKVVVKSAEGLELKNTGYIGNIILDQGLDFFGGIHGRGWMNSYCVIGTGSSVPSYSQTSLDNPVAISTGTDTLRDYSAPVSSDGMWSIWEEKKYTFPDLGAVTITELGLACSGTLESHILMTRALIKDYLGNPEPIEVKEGDVVTIQYKIHKTMNSNSDTPIVVNVQDALGDNTPYNVKVKSTSVNTSMQEMDVTVTAPLNISRYDTYYQGNVIYFSAIELRNIKERDKITSANTVKSPPTILSLGAYTPNSFKRVVFINVGVADGNIATGIRSLHFITGSAQSNQPNPVPFMPIQMRFGKVSDDTTLEKTSNMELTIPVEYRWGRSE